MCLVPVMALWLVRTAVTPARVKAAISHPLTAPIAFWLLCSIISAPFGFAPWRSITKLAPLPFYFGLILAVAELTAQHGWRRILFALLAGQSLAAFHTALEPLLPEVLQNILVGRLSEAGQLALTVTLAFGLALPAAKAASSPTVTRWARVLLPLLVIALIMNLKRGPWLGVSVGASVLLFAYARRLFPFLAAAALIVVTFVQPVRERLWESYDHFVIAGGRGTMWEIGVELAAKYPLGIGYKNSAIMQQFDPLIPAGHRHFHNNLINVAAETGWLGLMCFLWWVGALFSYGWRQRHESQVAAAAACALLAWQVAGLTEYNFGDSEVFMVALVVAGVMGGLGAKQPASLS